MCSKILTRFWRGSAFVKRPRCGPNSFGRIIPRYSAGLSLTTLQRRFNRAASSNSHILIPPRGYDVTRLFRRALKLDTGGESAYTTEFLDGPGGRTEGRSNHTSIAVRHRQGKRLEYYKKKLVTRREELTKTIARTQEEGRTADEDATVDLADKAANSYTKEFLFGMTNTDRTILNMIDAALKRIQSDEYGVCANCQEELQQKRLEAVPWAKHCLACQEKMEQGLLQ
jgi:DnaK suppressor protein